MEQDVIARMDGRVMVWCRTPKERTLGSESSDDPRFRAVLATIHGMLFVARSQNSAAARIGITPNQLTVYSVFAGDDWQTLAEKLEGNVADDSRGDLFPVAGRCATQLRCALIEDRNLIDHHFAQRGVASAA